MEIKMCKYCGGIVASGVGPHGRYCSKACWDAVDGFDKRLKTERLEGKVPFDCARHESDGGAGMEAMFDRLDGTEPKYDPKLDLAEVFRAASEIHPLLPSALVLLGQGMTQARAAAKVGLDDGNLRKYLKQLRINFTATMR